MNGGCLVFKGFTDVVFIVRWLGNVGMMVSFLDYVRILSLIALRVALGKQSDAGLKL